MAWRKVEDLRRQVEHFKKRVNQLLDFIEERGLQKEFEEWAKKNIEGEEEKQA